jgi:hypothetical protein
VRVVAIGGGRFAISSDFGAGIGTAGNLDADAIATVDSIRITNGSFAIATKTGAGIGGAGFEGTLRIGALGTARIGAVELLGGDFAINSTLAAAIGAGTSNQTFTSTIGSIAISGGAFDLASAGAAGIGAGEALGDPAGSAVGAISVSGGRFRVAGRVAFGSVSGVAGGLKFNGVNSQNFGLNLRASEVGLRAESIEFSRSDVVAHADAPLFVNQSFALDADSQLYVTFANESLPQDVEHPALLHLTLITGLPGEVFTFVFANSEKTFTRSVNFDAAVARGLLVSLPGGTHWARERAQNLRVVRHAESAENLAGPAAGLSE